MFKEYSKENYLFVDKDGKEYISTPEYNVNLDVILIFLTSLSMSVITMVVFSLFI